MRAIKTSASLLTLALLALTPRLLYPTQTQSTLPAASRTAPLTSIPPPPPAPIAYDTQPLPKDPAAALQLASQANGLGADGLKPWYLKAHYQTYDLQGKPAATGIFELYWAAKNRFRVSYTSSAFTQTVYHTPADSFRAGSSERMPYAEALIWGKLMYPVPGVGKTEKLELKQRKVGNMAFTCIQASAPHVPVVDAYCTDQLQAMLRIAEASEFVSVYNKIVVFQHHFVAEQIGVRDGAQQVLDVDLDVLRGMTASDMQALTPTSDSIEVDPFPETNPSVSSEEAELDPSGFLDGKQMIDHVLEKGPPLYPHEAKQRRAQGTVRIFVSIGKDGLVHDPVIVHQPDPALGQAALQAVSKWRYKPFVANGKSVEVTTVMNVTYILGG